mmetsp:Transcript_27109/g.26758  ORF Transcript_27109/g.26758 Transcript_27109/m.26758 type:complete len:111 (-) Transcript_27109:1617-1949(-)
MDCAQKFAYAEEEDEDQGMNLDEEEKKQAPKLSDSKQHVRSSSIERLPNPQEKYSSRPQRCQVDTNIVEINLNCLQQDFQLATGEPMFCSTCNCNFNSFSQYVRQEQNIV